MESVGEREELAAKARLNLGLEVMIGSQPPVIEDDAVATRLLQRRLKDNVALTFTIHSSPPKPNTKVG